MTDRASYFLTDLTAGASPSPGKKRVAPDTLMDLAYRVERLTPHPRRPERFHEEKSEIVAELHHLAHEVRRHG